MKRGAHKTLLLLSGHGNKTVAIWCKDRPIFYFFFPLQGELCSLPGHREQRSLQNTEEQLVATCQLTNPPALGEERGETPPQLTHDRPKLCGFIFLEQRVREVGFANHAAGRRAATGEESRTFITERNSYSRNRKCFDWAEEGS